MIPVLPALAVGTQLVFAVADGVPTFNIQPGCRAASDGTVGFKVTRDACLRSEREAREQLVKQWNAFPAADRASCVALSTTGGDPTYTELITCLEMRRDVRKLPKDGSAESAMGAMGTPARGRTKRR